MRKAVILISVGLFLWGCGNNTELEALRAGLRDAHDKLGQMQAETDRLYEELDVVNEELKTVTEKLVRVKIERDKMAQELRALGRLQ
ncbi:MAG: hypothetical protein OEY67_01775 [Gammaproteobacteria bacterium]|nr:hypothetical protein [Gammaproteobacteria bacterium]